MRTLDAAGIHYLCDLVRLTPEEVLRIRDVGRGRLGGVCRSLKHVGLHLGMDVGDWQSPDATAAPIVDGQPMRTQRLRSQGRRTEDDAMTASAQRIRINSCELNSVNQRL